MYEDSLQRLKDPKVRRPMIGLLVSYLAWVEIAYGVGRAELATGTEEQRWIGVALMMIPIIGMVAFFVHLHRQADEVERAIHGTAAAYGFVFCIVAGLLGMHLQQFQLAVQLTATHIWSTGMLAWLFGLWRGFRHYQ